MDVLSIITLSKSIFSSNLPLKTVFSFPCAIWLLTHRRFFRGNGGMPKYSPTYWTYFRIILSNLKNNFDIPYQVIITRGSQKFWSATLAKIKKCRKKCAKNFIGHRKTYTISLCSRPCDLNMYWGTSQGFPCWCDRMWHPNSLWSAQWRRWALFLSQIASHPILFSDMGRCGSCLRQHRWNTESVTARLTSNFWVALQSVAPCQVE